MPTSQVGSQEDRLMPTSQVRSQEDLNFLLADDASSDDEELTNGYRALGVESMNQSRQQKLNANRTLDF